MEPFVIRTERDLAELVERWGVVPFFAGALPGFSVEEHVAPGLWFSDAPGPWEWKGPVIRQTGCAYGKFFEKKAAWVSRRWFRELANYRRDGYDFDARYEDGLASRRDKALYDLVDQNGPVLSKRLKELGDYRPGGNKGFDTLLGRLQQQCYVVTNDFVYEVDRFGRRYGWGVAEYVTPEKSMGAAFTDGLYDPAPQESYRRLFAHLQALLPDADETALRRFLG